METLAGHQTTLPITTLLLMVLVTVMGCKNEDPVIIVDPPLPGPEPQQYGIPFDQVPEIGDIHLYEVNPRVFSASQDLDGITTRLDSLKKLGVNVVWLMPVYPTGSVNSVGSPYAVKDYRSVHADYGTLEDLRELVDRAHSLEMAVLLDWVANHTAWDHEWINYRSWYVRDGNGNIIHPPGTNWLDVAELNYNSSEMRQEMIRAMKYWILEANVDGYRCDFATGVPVDFWQQAIDTLRSIPDRDLILFAEAEEKELLSAGFDLLFGWSFYGKLRETFNGGAATQLFNTHLNEYSGLDPDEHVVRWVTNHDEHAWNATPQQIFGGNDATVAAFVLASCVGGVPLVYNGQEVAVPNQLPFFAGHNVTIDWALNPGIKAAYERILNFRLQSTALREGTWQGFSSADVVAFKKSAGTEEIVVVVNVRAFFINNFQLPSAMVNTTWYDAFDDSEVQFVQTLDLDPYEYMILKNF